MQLLADENIQNPTVEFLVHLGHDVRSVLDEGLQSAHDDIVLTHACQTGRVLLTHNVDFADARDLAGKHNSGIIRLRIGNQRVKHMHPILQKALEQLRDMDLSDTLVTITDRRVRIRHTFAF
ncbi:MAG: DUF5615 family PIN-like protein [Kiritimatiellia bacterium]